MTEIRRRSCLFFQLYVDFDDAFQDETTNRDYFGGESTTEKESQPANFYLQSIETISEVNNGSPSPAMRYQVSRENSRPSTPSDTSPFPPRSNLLSKMSQLNHSHRSTSSSNGHSQLSGDFTNLNLIESNNDSSPADVIRIRPSVDQPFDDSLLVSSQFKLILPQYFLVKYLGRLPCSQLWGAKAVRAPIDEMVQSARHLSTINEMPTLEACVNTRGLVLTHRDSPKQSERNPSPERRQNGLIPLEYISYVMHDLKYSKIAACIVLRQSRTASPDETSTECYGFLFQSKEHAHRFALSLAEAFNARKRSSRHGKNAHYEKREGRSPHRRTKQQRNAPSIPHHHERTRAGKYDDSYLRDSEV